MSLGAVRWYIKKCQKIIKKNAKGSIDNEPVISSIKSQSFSKSLTAIYILQSSLNFDEGKEIAENLYRVYEFCKDGVMKGFTKKDSKFVYDAIPPIDEILDGWKQIS